MLIPRPTALSVLAALSKFRPRGVPAPALLLKPIVPASKLDEMLRPKPEFAPALGAGAEADEAVPLGVALEG